jgi:hypothetical protein
VVLGDAEDGRRCVAISEDPGVAAHVVTDELIGRTVAVKAGSFVL